MATLVSLTLSGCTATQETRPNLSSIQLGQTSTPAPTQKLDDDGEISPVSDSFAELELEDQSGTGTSVSVEEVRVSLGDVFLVISDRQGQVLGYAIATPDSQPVQVDLDTSLTRSQELLGSLYLDNGDGIFKPEEDAPIRDGEGEIVSEDFDYRLTGD